MNFIPVIKVLVMLLSFSSVYRFISVAKVRRIAEVCNT